MAVGLRERPTLQPFTQPFPGWDGGLYGLTRFVTLTLDRGGHLVILLPKEAAVLEPIPCNLLDIAGHQAPLLLQPSGTLDAKTEADRQGG